MVIDYKKKYFKYKQKYIKAKKMKVMLGGGEVKLIDNDTLIKQYRIPDEDAQFKKTLKDYVDKLVKNWLNNDIYEYLIFMRKTHLEEHQNGFGVGYIIILMGNIIMSLREPPMSWDDQDPEKILMLIECQASQRRLSYKYNNFPNTLENMIVLWEKWAFRKTVYWIEIAVELIDSNMQNLLSDCLKEENYLLAYEIIISYILLKETLDKAKEESLNSIEIPLVKSEDFYNKWDTLISTFWIQMKSEDFYNNWDTLINTFWIQFDKYNRKNHIYTIQTFTAESFLQLGKVIKELSEKLSEVIPRSQMIKMKKKKTELEKTVAELKKRVATKTEMINVLALSKNEKLEQYKETVAELGKKINLLGDTINSNKEKLNKYKRRVTELEKFEKLYKKAGTNMVNTMNLQEGRIKDKDAKIEHLEALLASQKTTNSAAVDADHTEIEENISYTGDKANTGDKENTRIKMFSSATMTRPVRRVHT